ncbi:MAG: ribosome maturation factor RimM [Thermodesulfobacteriota bacterium]
MTDRRVVVGAVSSAHGVRGEVLVTTFTESDEFFAPGRVLLLNGPAGSPAALTVERSRPHKKGFLIAFRGLTDRDVARSYSGCELSVPREDLPDTEPGEYYWVDLVGLEVFSQQGEPLGRLSSIMDTGANGVLVISDPGTGQETLLPAIDSVILDVDLAAGRMTVEVPEGL